MLKSITRLFAAAPAARKTTSRPRLSVEALEDRSVPAFLTPVTSAGGGVPVVADFNHDGREDLAVVNGKVAATGVVPESRPTEDLNGITSVGWAYVTETLNGTTTVAINLSNGDSAFHQSAVLKGVAGYYLGGITATDVNADGRLDVVVTAYAKTATFDSASWGSYTTRSVNVWLGNGDGTFGKVTTTVQDGALVHYWSNTLIYYPQADFNRDGATDLATLSPDDDNLRVRLALSSGHYQTYTFPAGASLVVTGDFNGDGLPDLLTVNALASNKPTTSVWLNDGIW